MTAKPTYAELEQRIKCLEEITQANWIQTAVDASSDAIGISRADGQHFYQNKAFNHMFGYSLEEISRLHPRRLYRSEHVANEVFGTVMAGKSWHGEVEMVAKNGRRFPVSLRADAIKDENGDVIGLIGVHTDITDHILAETALRESEEKFRLISEQSLVAIGFIQDGLIKYVNQAYCDISGYSIDEIMNWEPYEYAKLTHPDDRAFVMEQVRKKQSGVSGAVAHYQFKGVTKSGGTKWLELYSKTVLYQKRNADLFMFIDITASKHVEQALQESKERFRRLASAAFEAIIIHEGGILISANDQYYEMFGYKPEELIGKQAITLTVAPEAISDMKREIAKGGLGPYESIGLKKDGTRFPIEIRVREWEYEGRKVRVAAIMDITERKHIEKELENYRKHLEELVKSRTAGLEAKNKELETFTYSVSHDLKAPLRGIDGYSRLLMEDYADRLENDGLLFLNNILHSAEQMNQLIEDLLAYSRMERRQFQPVSIEIRPMIDMLISQKAHDIEAGNISISVNLPFEMMTSDVETLRQVLGNYLDNAIKFMKKDISGAVEVGGQESHESWTLWVKDNGIGFDPKYHDRIFNIFQRLNRTEDFPGTGVGLAIVRKAVERIGGRVWAESEVGKGSTFFITIPKKAKGGEGVGPQ